MRVYILPFHKGYPCPADKAAVFISSKDTN